ncbi:membrane protein UL6 [Panine betaherpesvirus 2]|uniref:Membrane protein UL6 n=1 Tax=Panine betaherpesvirus 2 TaxID=188763 RepID=Q8QS80_9BETA|nr:membrane protein UL6 [Panine betaherpesvirus 2]AAM00657.1 membrane protein UL6 [Panine betaherpesvirus 2]QXV67759.1 membrane protein UL6 [Panine betaherpesvirus 2]
MPPPRSFGCGGLNKVWICSCLLILVLVVCAPRGSPHWSRVRRQTSLSLPSCSPVNCTVGGDVSLNSTIPVACNSTEWGRYYNSSFWVPLCQLWGGHMRLSGQNLRLSLTCSRQHLTLHSTSDGYTGTYYQVGNNCPHHHEIMKTCFNLTVLAKPTTTAAPTTTSVPTPTLILTTRNTVIVGVSFPANTVLSSTWTTTAGNASVANGMFYRQYQPLSLAQTHRTAPLNATDNAEDVANLVATYASWGLVLLLLATVLVLFDLGLPQTAWRWWRDQGREEQHLLL